MFSDALASVNMFIEYITVLQNVWSGADRSRGGNMFSPSSTSQQLHNAVNDWADENGVHLKRWKSIVHSISEIALRLSKRCAPHLVHCLESLASVSSKKLQHQLGGKGSPSFAGANEETTGDTVSKSFYNQSNNMRSASLLPLPVLLSMDLQTVTLVRFLVVMVRCLHSVTF
jgi:hypothetical protein